MENQMEVSSAPVEERKRRSFLADLFTRLIKEKPLGVIGGVILLVLLIVAILADVLAPFGMNQMNLDVRLSAPTSENWLGADHLGRDLLSRVIYGARISVIVGLAGTAISAFVSTVLGLISGFAGGKTDLVIQRIVDALMSFPTFVIALSLISLTGPGLVQVIFILGVISGYRWVRVIRSAVITIKENVYVEAARAIGVPNRRMLLRHILPNIMPVIIVVATINIGRIIIDEAALSFLGFGIPPPAPSWGGMLSGDARTYMIQAPWLALWPGVALALVVYGANMLGDAMRDLLDPRLRGGLGRYSGVKRKLPK